MKNLEYYKERACCDPSNEWGHTDNCRLATAKIKFLLTENNRLNRIINDMCTFSKCLPSE